MRPSLGVRSPACKQFDLTLGLGSSKPGCNQDSEQLHLDVAELDPPALSLEPDVPPGDLAGTPCVGHGTVDPESDLPALAGDLVGIPLARGFDSLLAEILLEVEWLESVHRQGFAEQVTSGGI